MRFNRFFSSLQQDVKLFCFFLLVLCVFRVLFLVMESSYLGAGTTMESILLANWAGLRLSLKSAGALIAPLFLFLTCIGSVALPRLDFYRVRLVYSSIACFLLSVLFMARFPYYRTYGEIFGQSLVQGLFDDRQAIFETLVAEYQFFPRLLGALLISAVLVCIARAVLRRGTYALDRFASLRTRLLQGAGLFLAIVFAFFFIRFGGALSYTHSINWENGGVTGDHFLDELILDDLQGLYRARGMYKRMAEGEIFGLERERLMFYAGEQAGGKDLGDRLEPYLERRATGARIEKPSHIFIILGESMSLWPLLPEYQELHAADELLARMTEEDAYVSRHFLSNGDFTSIALTGVITGLSEINTKVNYQPQSFQAPFVTAMAKPFHELGYRVEYWYGGYPSWDNMKQFALAQGFDDFYGAPDFQAEAESIWGVKDGILFDALRDHVKDGSAEAAGGQYAVHLVMTTTNHPPYNLNLEAEGLGDMTSVTEAVKRVIPAETKPENLAKELLHYRYMTREIARFIREVQEVYPDSLFIVTGDHGIRMNPGPQASRYEREAVPLILIGKGVSKDLLPEDVVGGHTSIVPTVMELIAPAGFLYHTIAPSMTFGDAPSFTRISFMTRSGMGEIEGGDYKSFGAGPQEITPAEKEAVLADIKRFRTLSWGVLENK
ncbi:LTA synthase family protein [Selenomonas sp. TAMA-11512]|uniref:LTA synthase family protein n=1 Tax=Selenomonas sp. TAMA-11512 TaxID=3095337 RepID=UPI0030886B4D|nr:LTA synthase family protein [Selenomonas sp. TAMA-11512]